MQRQTKINIKIILQTILPFVLSLIIMSFTAILLLLVLSFLTFHLTWYAPQAMGGIILVYLLTGFVGGITIRALDVRTEKARKQMRPHSGALLRAFLQGILFMLFLWGLSLVFLGPTVTEPVYALFIGLLIAASSTLGAEVYETIPKKG